MKPVLASLPALLLAVAALSGLACKAHVHGSGPASEVVVIDLTSGLT